MNRLLVPFGLVALLVPTLSLAQDTAHTSAIYCPSLSQTLSFGSSDPRTVPRSQVTELQKFLSNFYDLNPGDYVTGYFGRLTRDNVRRFQCEKMRICSGDEATTGWGVVGPRTRAKIRAVCNVPVPIPTPSSSACVNPLQPSLSCDGKWEKFFNKDKCHIGWTCVVTQGVAQGSNGAPRIGAIMGPTLLKPNVNGTWQIAASDPENEGLLYSVIWGDEGTYAARLLNIAQEGTPYSAATTILHTYKNTGAYTIVVFAKDTSGNIVKATLLVSVREITTYKNVPLPIAVGARVKATTNLNVRSSPSLSHSVLGEQTRGALGTITSGPKIADGHTWWNINWDSGPDGWSVQDYLKKVIATETVVTNAEMTAALQAASKALERANTALLNANNSVIVANGLRILPGTLSVAIPSLNRAIEIAKNSALKAVKHAQKALSLARTAHGEAMSAFQLMSQGQTHAAGTATKQALNLSKYSVSISGAVEQLVEVINQVKKLLSSAVI
ncbi:peptidoglycan-binding protein [Candidatus Kaiserbacteria bacterium]|nr:peptidoglycan-binding protein [Candidatus Kaiserbacteria bacterium]